MKRARTETFEHTISGLLTKRADLYGEAERHRQSLTGLVEDIAAMDRVLRRLGYDGPLGAVKAPLEREAIFRRGEFSRTVFAVLREADSPMTNRQIAEAVMERTGVETQDSAYVRELAKRASRALRKAERAGTVRKDERKGVWVWTLLP